MKRRTAFTLVEILIVVVILGILAAIVTPSLVGATEESAVAATLTDLHKLRRAVGVFEACNNALPPVVSGDASDPATWNGTGPWGPLVDNGSLTGRPGDYYIQAPINAHIGGANARRVEVVPGAIADNAFQTNYGWLYDPDTGNVFAGSFDANDRPIPRP